MFFKIKRQLFANALKGASQQVLWGTLVRVCLKPLNSSTHRLSVRLDFQPLSTLSTI